MDLCFGTTTAFISNDETKTKNSDDHSSSTSNTDDKPISKEDFFAIMDDFKASVLKDLSSISLFDSS